MTFTNDTFNKISVIRKDGHIAVLTEKELFTKNTKEERPVMRGKHIVFSLTRKELFEIRQAYRADI